MRLLLILAFVAVACASTVLRPRFSNIDEYEIDLLGNDGDIEYVVDPDDGSVEVDPQFIISWQVRRFIRKMQKQMPCGFPEYGIPPLAPVRVSETSFHLQKGIVETIDEVFRLRVDGLDGFKINKLKLNLIFSKITFDFTFNNIVGSAQKYDTDTIMDALRQLGVSVRYEGDGSLKFGLQKLRLSGVLRYKIPILWGSIKITSLQTDVTLGECNSEITGFAGNGKTNRAVNRQLEKVVESTINNNRELISDLIEDNLVPRVNKLLKGNNFWTLIDYIFSSSEGEKEDDPINTKCVPPPDPWA